jgi:Leucine-rich repeat (LRR) protein
MILCQPDFFDTNDSQPQDEKPFEGVPLAPQLVQLDISNSSFDSTSVARCLELCSSLTDLKISNLKIDDSCLVGQNHLRNIRNLDASNTEISDKSISEIFSFASLERISLSNCEQITDKSLDRFRRNSSTCLVCLDISCSLLLPSHYKGIVT